MDYFEFAWLSQNLKSLFFGFEILSTCVQSHLHELVLICSFSRNDQLTLAMKQSANGTLGGNAPTVLSHDAADFRGSSISIIRADFDQQRHSVWSVKFIRKILKASPLPATRSLFDGAV